MCSIQTGQTLAALMPACFVLFSSIDIIFYHIIYREAGIKEFEFNAFEVELRLENEQSTEY